jgi:two-component system, NtrC family, nitrogen regulation sensor histidine kinase GlnL
VVRTTSSVPAGPKPAGAPTSQAPDRLRWTDVLASISDGVVVLDADGLLNDLNPAAEQLLGVAASQAAGLPVEQLVAGRRANAWLAELARATLLEGLARRRSEDRLRARGQEVSVSAACAPVHDEQGVLRGTVLVLHDLTLERALDTTTRRADRLAAMGTVALGLAHEIRNPLGGIKGAAQLLRAGLSDPAQVQATDIIIREVDRLDGLVEQLRRLSTPPQLRIAPLNIHRILNDVLSLQRQAAEFGDITLRTEFDPSLPAVLGDRAQLTQVFLNLVKNAVDALGGRGQLIVSTRIETRYHVRRRSHRNQFLSVTIADDGPGVPEHAQSHLFSPFFTTKPRGTGLGLAVCHRIVAEHGGIIAHEPRPGGGARFRVTLPVSEDHVDPGT